MSEEKEQASFGKIGTIELDSEMQRSYIDYAMSVIVGRALPDVRDGLKPVHRRILYGMLELGLENNKPYKKSARIVGEVMGKFHPHGDSAIYDTLCRMAQEFSLRFPLVDGQGNFGSVDGDSPAAMRYTEARLASIAGEMLADLDKETVAWQPNFDESLLEPVVLPSKLPNLLVNGSTGIAVGMATNIPPHNLREVVDALVLLLDRPDATVDEIMEAMPGPDFPTGAFIMGSSGIRTAYETGRGLITLQAKTEIETVGRNHEAIVVTEIPYEVNKATLVAEIARLAEEKVVEGIIVRDESDKDGLRIVIELRAGENADVVMNQLFKHTRLRVSYGILNLALVRGRPRVMPLAEILGEFLGHRREVVTRRTQFELRKARERLHILEGYLIALDHIEEVIKLIRASKTTPEARAGLQAEFGLSERQADAVLAMPLSRLTGLEQDKIRGESEELKRKVGEYEEILANPALIDRIIRQELLDLVGRHANPRRTEIREEISEIDMRDLIKPETVVTTLSAAGYIKRTALDAYRRQKRGGTGVHTSATKEEDYLKQMILANTRDDLLVFTNRGRVYWLPVYRIPEQSRQGKGRPIVNFLRFQENEAAAALIPVQAFSADKFLFFVTAAGVVKRTSLEAFSRPRAGGIIALSLRDDDQVTGVKVTGGGHNIFLTTRRGMAIRFPEPDVRPMGRTATGVRGIRLAAGDAVVGAEALDEPTPLLTVTEKGYGKRTNSELYRLQKRGGKGVLDIKTDARNGSVVTMRAVRDTDEVILLSRDGTAIRSKGSDTRMIQRNTRGVRLMKLGSGNVITDCVINNAVPEVDED